MHQILPRPDRAVVIQPKGYHLNHDRNPLEIGVMVLAVNSLLFGLYSVRATGF